MQRVSLISLALVVFFSSNLFSEDFAKVLPRTGGSLISYELEGILSAEEIDEFNCVMFEGYEAPRAKYSVAIYWVTYESFYPDGTPALIKSQMFIPQFSKAGKKSLYAFGSGSTGIRDSCCPSREHILGIRWGLYRSHVLAHAGQGSIGVMPDYMGFGDPDRLQYYMVALCEARALLDGIRAAGHLLSNLSNPYVLETANFVSGFSQGGHAAFAAADLLSTYAPEMALDGIIGYGPTTNISELFKEYADVAPMVLLIYGRLYGEDKADPERILLPKYASTLEEDLLSMCVGGMQSYYSKDPEKVFLPEFVEALLSNNLEEYYPEFAELLRLNYVGLSGHGVPSLILQGSDDIVVLPPTQERFVEALRSEGKSVEYVYYEGVRHDTRQYGFFKAREWIDEKMGE
jgi:acetyl esterase/lipase